METVTFCKIFITKKPLLSRWLSFLKHSRWHKKIFCSDKHINISNLKKAPCTLLMWFIYDGSAGLKRGNPSNIYKTQVSFLSQGWRVSQQTSPRWRLVLQLCTGICPSILRNFSEKNALVKDVTASFSISSQKSDSLRWWFMSVTRFMW